MEKWEQEEVDHHISSVAKLVIEMGPAIPSLTCKYNKQETKLTNRSFEC